MSKTQSITRVMECVKQIADRSDVDQMYKNNRCLCFEPGDELLCQHPLESKAYGFGSYDVMDVRRDDVHLQGEAFFVWAVCMVVSTTMLRTLLFHRPKWRRSLQRFVFSAFEMVYHVAARALQRTLAGLILVFQ